MFKHRHLLHDIDSLHVIGGAVTDFFTDSGISEINLYGDDEIISLIWAECYWRKLKVKGCYGDKKTSYYMFTGERTRSDTLDVTDAPMPTDIPAIWISSEENMPECAHHIRRLTNYSRQKRLLLDYLHDYALDTNVKVILFNLPRYSDIETTIPGDDALRSTADYLSGAEKKKLRRTFLNELYGKDDYSNIVLTVGKFDTVKNEKGVYFLKDVSSEYVNVENGYRVVPNRPESFDRTVWTFGNSLGTGYVCDDHHTIQYALQEKLNENLNVEGCAYGVVNASNGGYPNYDKMRRSIDHHKPKENDIIVIIDWINPLTKFNKKYKETFIFTDVVKENGLFEPPHEELGKYIYIDNSHLNFKAYYKLGECLGDIVVNELKSKDK